MGDNATVSQELHSPFMHKRVEVKGLQVYLCSCTAGELWVRGAPAAPPRKLTPANGRLVITAPIPLQHASAEMPLHPPRLPALPLLLELRRGRRTPATPARRACVATTALYPRRTGKWRRRWHHCARSSCSTCYRA